MEPYRQDRERQRRLSLAAGIGLTAAVHAAALLCACYAGMTYLDPPPPERQEMLIDFDGFEAEVKKPEKRWSDTRVKSPKPDRTKKDNPVKMSKAQMEGTKENVAREATVGSDGDVEVNEPKREKEINRRALYHAADNPEDRDTLAAQTAHTPSDALETGHAMGNVAKGTVTGEPNARLEGRTTVGALKKPAYDLQREGTVVVRIKVNQNGTVTEAIPGYDGTTVSDVKLWNAARKAAMEARFSKTADITKTTQYGTITYLFRLSTAKAETK